MLYVAMSRAENSTGLRTRNGKRILENVGKRTSVTAVRRTGIRLV